ncbi:DUF3850 domain-containing protein [Desulfohalovibrio reitneri]|uniref:DUF3850 domain-containing protein n=1 Tax=Desulfohalovibrio reitneri TaxID=1307759 RepID=UPI0004A6D170|nr:DUF3850 domain-containing protein [Desulfohalovibrio reitneri]
MKHELKCEPGPFLALLEGRKRVELRFDDRGFAEGDTLLLREIVGEGRYYTGRHVEVSVLHVLHGGQYGLQPGWVAMSIELKETA